MNPCSGEAQKCHLSVRRCYFLRVVFVVFKVFSKCCFMMLIFFLFVFVLPFVLHCCLSGDCSNRRCCFWVPGLPAVVCHVERGTGRVECRTGWSCSAASPPKGACRNCMLLLNRWWLGLFFKQHSHGVWFFCAPLLLSWITQHLQKIIRLNSPPPVMIGWLLFFVGLSGFVWNSETSQGCRKTAIPKPMQQTAKRRRETSLTIEA